MMKLFIPSKLARQIEAEGAAIYPNECCGILYGRDTRGGDSVERRVDRLQAVENVFESGEQYHRFSISPRQLMTAEKAAADQGDLVLGFYHSHPDHPARPSEYDRAHAWPFYSYIIVSIEKKIPAAMTSWLLNETSEQFEEQAIVEDK